MRHGSERDGGAGCRQRVSSRVLKRFLLSACPLLFLLFVLFHLGIELAGFTPDLGRILGSGSGRSGLPPAWILGTWVLEVLGLSALYLLVTGPGVPRFSTGLLAAWIAWLFRGPLLVITAVGFGRLPPEPWWRLTLRWFLLYTLAGLVLGFLGSRLRPAVDEASSPDS